MATLGRGLASLIPQKKNQTSTPATRFTPPSSVTASTAPRVTHEGVQEISVDEIVPNPDQPRRIFAETELRELSESIKEHGVLQPLLIRKTASGPYQLIAGERRLQAARLAGIAKVPAILKEIDDEQNLEIALVENVQREDLNPMEVAKALAQLRDEFGMSYPDIARKVGKSEPSVKNTVRLLKLPEEVRQGLLEGKITEGHARAILTESDMERQIALYHEIVAKKLSVRQAETLARHKESVPSMIARGSKISPLLVQRISHIEQSLGTRMRILKKGAAGKLAIEFYSDEELEKILNVLDPQGDL